MIPYELSFPETLPQKKIESTEYLELFQFY